MTLPSASQQKKTAEAVFFPGMASGAVTVSVRDRFIRDLSI